MKSNMLRSVVLFLIVLSGLAHAAEDKKVVIKPNKASSFTQDANKSVLADKTYDWQEKDDVDFAARGKVCPLEELQVRNAKGRIVWNNEPYDELFKSATAPESVNPSLWRHERLSAHHGLYKVAEGVYQVRGQDLSNITFIVTPKGYIVIDPLACKEVAASALKLVKKKIGDHPVIAVIYSHSHIDHFAGVKGVVSEEDVKAGKVQIIAPKGFADYAIEENVTAGNAMSRRAIYMYGSVLPVDQHGQVGAGEGKAVSSGERTLILPTKEIPESGEKLNVGGLDLVFNFDPGEAPVGVHVYIPSKKALYLADNCVHGIPNIYTIRGALTRNPIKWMASIASALKFKDAEVCFAGHNWPRFGKDKVVEYLTNQHDAIKYMHDQTLNLINSGYNAKEIEHMVTLPASLASKWYLRNYYGDIRHNVRAIYNLYMGWYDANPANLNPLPPREEATKFVAYMGGGEQLLKNAQQDYDKGEYRWVVRVLDLLLWAEPKNKEAQKLAAAAQEQLGYQAECSVWRNAYLTAAKELRGGISKGGHSSASPDIVAAMSLPMFFDYLAIKLDAKKAADKMIVLNWSFPDIKEDYVLELNNSVLKYRKGKAENADASISVNRKDLPSLFANANATESLKEKGQLKITGDTSKMKELFGMLDKFNLFFPVATH